MPRTKTAINRVAIMFSILKGVIEMDMIDRWKVGDCAKCSRIVTEDVINDFAKLSGDYNRIHLDEEYAATTILGRRIAHGLFCASIISYLVGVVLPGDGAIFLDESLKYKAPVYVNDNITGFVEIVDINAEKRIMKLTFKCVNQDDVVVLTGTTNVKVL